MSTFEATAQSDVDGRLSRIQDRVQVLDDRTTAQKVANDGGGRVREGPQANLGITSMLGVDTASHESIMDRLKILESKATGETCGLSGFNFLSLHDVVAFVTKFSVPTYALYWDMLSAMVCMQP